jgi:glycosyltransferase involved in cell wall biosynthesis
MPMPTRRGESRTYIYLPYADEQATGLQRFGSEIIRALLRTGMEAEVLIGEVQGQPQWLTGVPHKVVLKSGLTRRLPRPATSLLRLLWLQFVLPLRARRGSTLLTLADQDLAVFPLVRQIAVVHDLTQAGPYRQKASAAQSVRIWLSKIGLRRSEQLIAISPATRDDLVNTFAIAPDRISVIDEGFDPAIFSPGERRSGARPTLLYAGTLAPNKNIPFLLEVFAELRERGFDVELQLVGRYLPERFQELVAAMAPEHRAAVLPVGFVSDAELAERMRSCTAFVFPSLSEGFGLAPVEAMACGAPVVSSEATSLKTVVGEGGVLLSPHDRQGWVEALVRVLSDESCREELSRRALRRSRAFSWDRAAQAYRELIELPRAS